MVHRSGNFLSLGVILINVAKIVILCNHEPVPYCFLLSLENLCGSAENNLCSDQLRSYQNTGVVHSTHQAARSSGESCCKVVFQKQNTEDK